MFQYLFIYFIINNLCFTYLGLCNSCQFWIFCSHKFTILFQLFKKKKSILFYFENWKASSICM